MSVKKIVSDLAELYKSLLRQESTDKNEVDFLLESLHEKGEAIRRQNESSSSL